jgi:hypothetical protein
MQRNKINHYTVNDLLNNMLLAASQTLHYWRGQVKSGPVLITPPLWPEYMHFDLMYAGETSLLAW